ncbi:FAD/NAD(P)-binding protein [Tardiphaga sp. 709]|uniref:FAD/NAD(P)-binding protein n=1 Tax=Tardiphaga sp. 709 TaxID=3076039 RepID=UPI0028EB5BA8|nr:FAD/NAD(P)-binding protein [Tardiphaga sp. 709]WNV11293.1 FAD/NAD(P)-binding protein [Tardiphaga sp. 709]
MTSASPHSLRVAVIGGGVAGAFAALILSKLPQIGTITVLDRDGAFGRGLAYSAKAQWHRINVPAYKMGGLGADDDGFVEWLTETGQTDWPDYSTSFVPRRVYGDYISTKFNELTGTGRVTPWQDVALSVARQSDGYRVATASGAIIDADLVFLCLGNQPPSPFPGIEASPRSITNVWTPGALDPIGKDDRVLVIGTGATAVDMVIDLVHRGMRAPITMVSRRGLLPLIDVPAQTDPDPMTSFPVPTARGLLAALLRDTRRKVASGIPWQTMVDTFRLSIGELYRNASETERARFARHLRAIWMVHRHRLAPDVAELLEELQRDNLLDVVAGRIASAIATPSGHDVTIRKRGHGEMINLATNWILNCTGPEERYDRLGDPLIKSLLATGYVRTGFNGLGLDVAPTCELRDSAGHVQPGFYAIGPATRGAFWEVTAASNIRRQLLAVSEQLKTL